MPHIHTQPGQHDITVSAYVLRKEQAEWKCLVHWHRKMDVLAQVGGHIELDQTPWQALAAELIEESGYQLSDVKVLQPKGSRVVSRDTDVAHPLPFAFKTYNVGDEHYHTDLCYGFVAQTLPSLSLPEGESNDLRWCTLSELESFSNKGETLSDIVDMYRLLVDYAAEYDRIDAAVFSTEKPSKVIITYKRGRPSEGRKL